MIFLAITPAGLASALGVATAHDDVWCGSDAISEADYAALKRSNVSRFIYELGDRASVEDALNTIEQHHPGETVWVEGPQSK